MSKFTTYAGNPSPMLNDKIPTFMAVSKFDTNNKDGFNAVVMGIPFDGVPTYRGGKTAMAPGSIRQFSLLYGGYNLDLNFDIFNYISLADAGDVVTVPGNAKVTFENAEKLCLKILEKRAIPIVIGGDHGINIPITKSIAAQNHEKFGAVIFDTHLDLRDNRNLDRLTRSSPCRRLVELNNVDPKNVCIIGARGPRNTAEQMKVAKKLGINIYPMKIIDERGIDSVAKEAVTKATVNGRPPYISVDIDSLDAAYAPATNSPETCGLTSRELINGLRIVAKDGFLGFDLVEVVPEFDSEANLTSVVAARIIVEALGCLAKAKRNK